MCQKCLGIEFSREQVVDWAGEVAKRTQTGNGDIGYAKRMLAWYEEHVNWFERQRNTCAK